MEILNRLIVREEMPTRTEEKLQSMLEEHDKKILEDHTNYVNSRVSVIFTYGFIVGLIVFYAGILPFTAGLGTGFIFSSYFTRFSSNINRYILDTLQSFQNMYKKEE